MKLLLDECVPARLARSFPNTFKVTTVRRMGWGGIKNGDLLERAGAQGFNALITIDGGMEGEQNLNGAPLTIVVMAAHPNHLQDLQPLVPRVVSILADNPGKSLVRVRAETGNAR